jgi:hypothetical protein
VGVGFVRVNAGRRRRESVGVGGTKREQRGKRTKRLCCTSAAAPPKK